ncbi:flavin-containing monooxygenase [Caulobacter sp. NIBR2454]|uniref:flavin-containing monooxygenase n=1 Tax=Caulobacter sp. NIBR2454 TaxID=3015996 RepID=UPI0022B70B51|nr:NAD(P)/FAD-dependent oxidoreductase [Caulobacter sp. NIBR2454]
MNAPFKPAGQAPAKPDVDVAILGSGFSGLGMAIALLKDGRRDFVILEKAASVGGTWRDNTYPGCACDVPSHLYSFSFEPNPEWSRMYPTQPEIRAYLERVADKYDLRPYLRFGKTVTDLTFDEAGGFWKVTSDDGQTLTARVVVSGTGGLSRPVLPSIKGMDSFKGKAFHSAWWDHDEDLTGKTVAVIGTGASAIQFVPQIAPKVKSLTLFQRTPPWIVPKLDRPMHGWEKALFKAAPVFQKLLRGFIYTRMESRAAAFVFKPEAMAKSEALARQYIDAVITDPALREKVTPNYRMGCKRILISNDYYPALNRENVALVTDGIAEITPSGVRTTDGIEHKADVIIYGTGFAATDALSPTQVHGRGGRHLNAEWAAGAQAYLGVTVSGYPNFFMLMGPNTGLGHNSIVYMIESQIRHVMDGLRRMEAAGAAWMDPKREAQNQFNAFVQERVGKTVWNSGGCKSWYLTADGRNTTIWPGFTFDYRRRVKAVDPTAYDMERVRAEA